MEYPGKELNEKVDSLTNKRVPPVEFEVRTTADLARLRATWSGMDSIPKLLVARTGSEDSSFLNLDIRTLLRGEESAGRHAVHSLVLPAGVSIPAHGLESGNAAWFVIRGEVEVTIGALTRRLKAPACAYAPEHATQAITNVSGGGAEVCVIHSPAGADRAFAAARSRWQRRPDSTLEEIWAEFVPYGFIFTGGKGLANDARTNAVAERVTSDIERFEDYAALRDRWSRLAPIPKIVEFPRESTNLVPFAGSETRLMITPEESRSHASAFFCALGKGVGALPHHQISEDEFFLVISGSMNLRVGNAFVESARSGAFGYAPRNATHTFTGEADELTVFFTMNSPGGHDRGFEAGVREAASFNEPRFQEMMQAHGFTFHQDFATDELIKIPSAS